MVMMAIKKEDTFLPLGMFSMVVAIALDRFVLIGENSVNPLGNFIFGMLLGMSIVFNLAFLITRRKLQE